MICIDIKMPQRFLLPTSRHVHLKTKHPFHPKDTNLSDVLSRSAACSVASLEFAERIVGEPKLHMLDTASKRSIMELTTSGGCTDIATKVGHVW